MSSMQQDEQAIREVLANWASASKAGDTAAVLELMDEDALFMVPGREPFGKEAFAAQSQAMAGIQIDAVNDIKEIKILGDWAWMRNHLKVTMTRPNEKSVVRSGYTLTIFKKNAAGRWPLYRDANMLATRS